MPRSIRAVGGVGNASRGLTLQVITTDVDLALEHLEAKLTHMEIPLAEIAPMWSSYLSRQFSRAPWPPLKQSTIEIKQAMGYSTRPLVRTGKLEGAVDDPTWIISGGVAEAVARKGFPGYGQFHITGFRHRSSGWVPARDWTMIDENTLDSMVRVFAEYLVDREL